MEPSSIHTFYSLSTDLEEHNPPFPKEVPSIYDTALEALEHTKPAGRHPANFRQFEMTLAGRATLIGVMANPVLFGTEYPIEDPAGGIAPEAAIAKVKAAGYTNLICLEKRAFTRIKEIFGKKAFLFELIDFDRPSIEMLENILRLVLRATISGEYTIFCCHSGFGRSGVAAAAMKIADIVKRDNLRCPSPLTAEVQDIEWNSIETTECVRKSVLAVRVQDPENGVKLRERNGNSALNGPTVENKGQFKALEEFEVYYISDHFQPSKASSFEL